MSVVYLASPYSHPEERVRLFRFQEACRAAARLMKDGFTVFAPVAHSHAISCHLRKRLATDHEFWMRQDLPILKRCSDLFVLRLDGWQESRGIKREIAYAESHGIDVKYVDPT